VLLGLALGVLTGLFVGEGAAVLQPIGDVFVGLLQMTVLPYIVLSIAISLGRLSYPEVGLLARKGGAFVLLSWALAALVVLGMAVTLPSWPSATFFSTSLIEERAATDPVRLYVPANPFAALADGVVPAIVLLSLAFGLALTGVPRKQRLLEDLEVASDVVMRIAQFVVRLAPLGVFALVAATAGTISVEDFERLQVYFFAYVGAALLLSLWVLPALVSTLTPIPFRRVLTGTQDALITAFATYNLLIVLPLLSQRIQEMLDEQEMLDADSQAATDLIVPLNFNLPNLGKLLALGFVPFAGWWVGTPVAAEQYPQLLGAGLLSLFGETVVALPFLLDLMRVPSDTFQVFIAVDQLAGRFGTLLAGVHTVALALLTSAAVSGRLRLRWVAIGRVVLVSLLLGLVVFVGGRLFFERIVPVEYSKYEELAEIELLTERPETREVGLEQLAPLPSSEVRDRLQVIQDRGRLRVGYPRASLPYVYRRDETGLVGMDVDLVQLLAMDLGVGLDFVEVPREQMAQLLRVGSVDVLAGGLLGTPERARAMRLSRPYMQVTLSLLVRDHRRQEFQRWDRIESMQGLRLAVTDVPFLVQRARRNLPGVEITVVEAPGDFMTAPEGRFDALVFSAEAGSAWTLLHPQFTVVVPGPGRTSSPVVLGLPADEPELAAYVDAWLELQESSRLRGQLYDYWILGKGAEQRRRRWSILHDVLGWGADEPE
jgi:Na+/H+-dicarboxylate symporter